MRILPDPIIDPYHPVPECRPALSHVDDGEGAATAGDLKNKRAAFPSFILSYFEILFHLVRPSPDDHPERPVLLPYPDLDALGGVAQAGGRERREGVSGMIVM